MITAGIEVDSDVPGGLTENHDGTSVATPFVTGEAALIWGVNPDLICKQVRDIILNNYIYEVSVTGRDSQIIKRPYANAFLAVEAATNESSDVATSSDAKIDPSKLGFGKDKEEGILGLKVGDSYNEFTDAVVDYGVIREIKKAR